MVVQLPWKYRLLLVGHVVLTGVYFYAGNLAIAGGYAVIGCLLAYYLWKESDASASSV